MSMKGMKLTMKMILKYLEKLKKECVLAPLFKMLEALFELFVPLVVASIIDRGIASQDTGYIVKSCLMLLLLAVIGLTCSITAQYFSAKAAVGCATGIRHALFKHIQSLSFTELDELGTSTLITRMTSDINQVQNGVIRAFNKQEDELKHFKEKNEELNHLQKFVGKISGLMNPLTYVVVNVSIIALIWIGGVRVNQGALTQGQVVALYNYMSQILVELIKLANLIINITKALACAGRIQSIFDVKPGMQDGTAGVKESDDEVPVVEFKNVALTYSGAGDTSIAGVSFKAYRGQTIGIIGGTGSGKSSLVGLIPRFYDATEGEVLIDGVNVKDIMLEELRDKVGIVMQKAVLFKGSIRNNMQVAKQDATDGEIDEALAIAQAKEFVDKKDGRLDYMIEQGGKNLSGGQRQRLTIARAVVKKPDVLILDDSASALDFATDAALRKSIRTMPNNPTVFIVSQRSASLMHADKIIVLDDGNVAGIGTHSELLANCEVYREIYNSQFKSAKGA